MPTQILRIRRYALIMTLAWTFSIACSFAWLYYQESRSILEIARAEARVAFEKDALYRKWAASQGGIYVPADEKTPPNPDLAHIPERDIVTPSGKVLTLMNPAYMTRQVFELADKEKAMLRGHITSLRPIRRGNAPAPWEARALTALEHGSKEFSELIYIDGQRYMRLMYPFITEQACLKCHASQGYKVGDLRGGISVSVPLAAFSGYTGILVSGAAAAYGFIWLFGVGMIAAGRRAISQAEQRLREQMLLLEQEVAERQVAQESLQEQAVILEEEIEERRQAEEAGRLSEERFSKAFQLAPLIMTITVASDGTFLDVNNRFTELSGFSREEALGWSSLELGWISVQTRSMIQSDLLLEGRVSGRVFPLTTKDGRTLTCEYFGELIPVGGDQCILSIALDVTEQKKLEEQLRHSQKLEAVGQLAGGVAHDFNNILMVILGYGGMLEMEMKRDDPLREKLVQMLAAAEKATQLTHALLAFSRKQVMTPQITNLNDIVQGVQKFLVRIIGENVQMKSIFNEAELIVNADRGQIEQVLINLITNARDAMPRGGLLTVETKPVKLDAANCKVLGCAAPGLYALVSVTDTGTGMDEETRKRIFEPFFTTKETGKGTGLGMAIVHGIVNQHNGFIDIDSEPGNGTTFRIYLPIVEKEQTTDAGAVAEQPVRGGSETILVAEDEHSVSTFMESILRQFGYQVILARDGEDAVEKFVANREKVRLIIMDVIMPKKSGKEAYDEISKLDPGVRVLFSSGYPADIIRNQGDLDGRAELIMKPIHPLMLLRKVRQMLDS